ncbi:MAG: undecaprenyldiphospho-muramoylpentapeptide beta-N-acetylglucosaminyltransferase [Polyangiaceae bacterium]
MIERAETPGGASIPRVVIAGGGTGGHVFPGLAVAEAMRALADVEVVFVGSKRGLESRIVPDRGYRLELLDSVPMKGGGVLRGVVGAAVAGRETARALSRVPEIAPRAVLSVGGYAAGPFALASTLRRVPLAILEPNSVVGFANRLLARFAARAYLAFDLAASPFKRDCVRPFGVPLRAGFAAKPYVATNSARVLVLGGSQGASALNERLPETFARVAKEIPQVQITHQAGRNDEETVRRAYAENGVGDVRVIPFIDDVAKALAEADVVVARAGAGTVAEITAVGRAAVLVPFPFAADDHQAKNAMSLAASGGAVCIRQEVATVERLAEELTSLLRSDTDRTRVAHASMRHGRPDAAFDVARDFLGLAGIAITKSPTGRESEPARATARNGKGSRGLLPSWEVR